MPTHSPTTYPPHPCLPSRIQGPQLSWISLILLTLLTLILVTFSPQKSSAQTPDPDIRFDSIEMIQVGTQFWVTLHFETLAFYSYEIQYASTPDLSDWKVLQKIRATTFPSHYVGVDTQSSHAFRVYRLVATKVN